MAARPPCCRRSTVAAAATGRRPPDTRETVQPGLAPDDGRVALRPHRRQRAVGDAPALRRSRQAVLVGPTDQEVVAALGAPLDVLALQVAAVRGRVAVDGHLVVADEVLGRVEPAERTLDAGDDGVQPVAVDAVEVGRGVRGEDRSQVVELLRVERPRVGDGEIDDGLLVTGHAVNILLSFRRPRRA